MIITLAWWYAPVFLFAVPFIYGFFRKDGGQFDVGLDIAALGLGCWAGAIGLLIGHFT